MLDTEKLNEMRVRSYRRSCALRDMAGFCITAAFFLFGSVCLFGYWGCFTPIHPISAEMKRFSMVLVGVLIVGFILAVIGTYLFMLARKRYPDHEKMEIALKREHLI